MTIQAKVVVQKVSNKSAECLSHSRVVGPATCCLIVACRGGAKDGEV